MFCWPLFASCADLYLLHVERVCMYDGARLDLVCDVKGAVQYLLRLMSPHKGEVNVGGVPHKT